MPDAERVLIIEQRSSGHLLVYVRELINEAIRLGMHPIVALGTGVDESSEFAMHLVDAPAQFVAFHGQITPRLINTLSDEYGARRIIVPHGDELASQRPLLRGWRLRGGLTVLVMRDPAWELGTVGGLRVVKLWVKLLLLRRLEARPGVRVVWLRSYGYGGARDHVIDPFISDVSIEDVRQSRSRVRTAFGLDEDTFWFVVTGAISMRKNLALVLDALLTVRAAVPGRKVGLAIIGPVTEGRDTVNAHIREARSVGAEIRIHDRWMQNGEMNDVVSSADAVVMAYSSHSPNSTMLKAKVLGTRIVVAGPPSVCRFAHDMGLDLVGSLDELSTLMIGAMESPVSSGGVEDPPSGEQFARNLLQPRPAS